MKHWFLDTNVLIDFLTDRQPFASAANTIFRLAYAGEVQLYVASLSFNTAFYLMRRSFATRSDAAGASQLAQQQLMQIKSLLTVVAVDDARKPVAVPPLGPFSLDEKQRHQDAAMRKSLRQELDERFKAAKLPVG